MKKIFLLALITICFSFVLKAQFSLKSGVNFSLIEDNFRFNTVFNSQISYNFNKYLAVSSGFYIDGATRKDDFLYQSLNYTYYETKLDKIAYLGLTFSPLSLSKQRINLQIAAHYEISEWEGSTYTVSIPDENYPDQFQIEFKNEKPITGFGTLFSFDYSYFISHNISLGYNFTFVKGVEYNSIYSGFNLAIYLSKKEQ